MYYPYVYKITNIETDEFYIGYRSANVRFKRTPIEDLLIHYFTSSKTMKFKIKANPDKFKGEILFSFDDTDIVYWYEQVSIKQQISNSLCMNKSYNDPDTNEKKFDTTKSTPWNKGVEPSLELRALWSEQRKGKTPKCATMNRDNWDKSFFNDPEYRSKLSKARTGAGNGMSKWIYITPMGEFTSITEATIANSIKRETLYYRCKHSLQGFSLKSLA